MANTTKLKKSHYKPQYTAAQKRKILKSVEDLKQKLPLSRAIVKAGITYATYQAWKGNKPAKKKSALESFIMPLDQDSPLVVLVGRPQDVNSVLQQLATVLKG